MWQNYLKTAFRNLWRNKIFSLLNILGLSLGITSALLLYFFIHFEFSMDSFHSKKDRIYRLTERMQWQENQFNAGMTSGMLAPQLKKDFPAIELVTRVQNVGQLLMKQNKHHLYLDNVFYVDSNFFDIFSYEFLEGNPHTCLDKPNSIVLTQKATEKIFGHISGAIGKSIKIDNKFNATVTAIVKNPPQNSSFEFQAWISITSALPKDRIIDSWSTYGDLYSFVLLKAGEDVTELEKTATKHIKRILIKNAWRAETPKKVSYQLSFQPLSKMHLYSADMLGGGNGNINDIYILSFIAIFILMIASINYINLSTARSISRAKEVGIRKVLGSHKKQLIGQFLLESTILVFIAILLSLVIAELLTPLFSQILHKPIEFIYTENPEFFLFLLISILILSLLSGLYPAFVLSSFKPALVLKGKFSNNQKTTFLRKSLVIFQFSISIIFMISTLLFYSQLQFMKNKELGLDNKNTIQIIITNPKFNNKKIKELKQAFSKNVHIELVTAVSNNIGRQSISQSTFIKPRKNDDQNLQAQYFSIDRNFLKLFDIKLKKGRFFSNNSADSAKYILINETFAQKLGGVEKAVGQKLIAHVKKKSFEIIGVVSDFHLLSKKEAIKPLVMMLERNTTYSVYAKLKKNANPSLAMREVKAIYKKFETVYPFEGEFVEQHYATQYEEEERQTTIFLIFTGLAIFIACLGLLGLASYTVQQKLKEVGVRKVLGASVNSILWVVSKDFLFLVVVASVFALPIAFYFMNNWLNDFAYRINLMGYWYVFLFAIFIAFLIAGITILTQAFRATYVNPISVLKDE